ncbi:uncharacterized protein LOC128227263 isoform X2 [Mya arenaria]|uniref:uncharacterized protein LOC128227263 isoform X2 n=1 Tax=Mya arenaria TaxID=6604 RepID=UPI0022E440EC|nr:uncharacterized protein LOC128227263 isoform X2 [Mya arenaria]
MSSWLAALGPCASPKSKAKEHKHVESVGKPLSLSSIKRRGSLTDVRPTRKVTGSRSFREKIHDTFEGSLRKVKKAGSLEAVHRNGRGETYDNPDTNMNVSTSFKPKQYKGNHSGTLPTGAEIESAGLQKDKFWTNFYNTLPRNRHKERPKDLSLQDLPVTEKDSETDLTQNREIEMKPNSDGQWQGYATSPRTRRKNKGLERMNSAPSSRNSPMKGGYDNENRAASDGQASPQIIELADEQVFENSNGGFIIMPRSVSLQEEYWMPGGKGGSKVELRKVTPSPDRLGARRSPVGSPVQVPGHVWVRTKEGNMELRPIERHPRDLPSPSDSQKTDSSSAIYNMTANTLSSIAMVPKFPVEDKLPAGLSTSMTQTQNDQSSSQPGSLHGSYMSPEEYQANIFELINSLNQSTSNPASPEVKRSQDCKGSRSPLDKRIPVEDGHQKSFHTERFIVLGHSEGQNDYEKREQPIFSVRAHVFQIDPETKKNWLPSSKTAVAVSYYYDSARNTYRIISVEGSKAIINSTITPNMAFTKTSQKFGQWSDPRANTVYGLGFGTEADLSKFIEKFKEVKEMTRQQLSHSTSPPTVNGTDDTPSSSATTTPRETPTNRGFFHTRSSSLTSMRDNNQQPPQPSDQKENINLRERRNSFNTPGSNGTASPESQVKYENDRLKLALAQSSSNAKKWEVELQTLKNNNARLTAALQESTANVEEWKKQLAGYKDETGRLKKRVSELEGKSGDSERVSDLESEVTELNDTVQALQRDNSYKDQEVDRLQQRLAEMQTRETANGNLQNKLKVGSIFRSSSKSKLIKALEEENRSLHQKVHDLQQLLQDYKTSQESEKDELVQMQDHLGSKITELYEFHEQIVATLRKESES